ncbi:hypothetical protein P4391_12110, partial [Bacillus thuringiensis]|nr:hypothetical protein [Bacillus thuringiensis]MED3298216.1 hypothetical protein [Bacillus thuringiensis]
MNKALRLVTKNYSQNDYGKHFPKVHRTLFYPTGNSIKPVIIVINVGFPIPDDPVPTIIMFYLELTLRSMTATLSLPL